MQPFFQYTKVGTIIINIYIVDFLYELTFNIVFLVVDFFYNFSGLTFYEFMK
jgi:hypothetical protein